MVPSPPNICTIRGYWCNSAVRLAKPLKTPLGSRITILTVCVDVHYSVQGGEIFLHGVEPTKSEEAGLQACNVASPRTGEAFRAIRVYPESELVKAVQDDLSAVPSHLGRLMLGRWREVNPDAKMPYLAEPFKVSVCLSPPADRMDIGPREGCGQVDLLTRIESGQLVCPTCLRAIRAQ